MLTQIQPLPPYAKMANQWAMAKAADDAPQYPPNSLALLRKAKGLSQPALARLTREHVSQQQISKLEKRQIELKGYQLRALAAALGCTADAILADPGIAAGPAEDDATAERISHDFKLEFSHLLRDHQLSDRDDRMGFLEEVRQLYLRYQLGRKADQTK